jgi:photosystem II stability/assembly factor-like uncharacterized protein
MSKRIVPAVCVLAALAAGLPAPARGAGIQWKAIGPWSEDVEALAIDPKNPRTLYAATRNGVFKSIDGAETWVRKSKGIEKVHGLCLAIDPKTPSTLYVGAWSGGLFKSSDGGESWTSLRPSGGMAAVIYGRMRVEQVAVDPNNPRNLMFTERYKSATGGADFTEMTSDALGHQDLHAYAFDPKNPRVVYAAGAKDIRKSTDLGATWTKLEGAMPERGTGRIVAIHPGSGELLLGTSYEGLHKSSDGGKTWTKVGEGLNESAHIFAIAWNPADPKNVYVASNKKTGDETTTVWRSDDGGQSFDDVGRDLPYEKIQTLVIDPADPKVLYAGTPFSGVFKTTDAGKTWNEKSVGFQSGGRNVRALAVSGPGSVFVTTYGAVYRTADDGKSWRRLRSTIQKGLDYAFLAAGGAEKPLAIAGADDSRLVRSSDGGETWSDPPRSAPLTCVAPDPQNPRAFYLCVEGGGVLWGGDGSSWRPVTSNSEPTFLALAVDPQNPKNMFAGTHENLKRSTDGGKKWKEWKQFEKVKGGVVRPADSRRIFAISFDAKNPKAVYVATREDGILKSADAGETWTLAGLTGEKLTAFAVDPADSQRLLVGTKEKGVMLSTDGGATWADASAGLPLDEDKKKKERVSGIAFAPGSPASLYVATEGGVYRAQ